MTEKIQKIIDEMVEKAVAEKLAQKMVVQEPRENGKAESVYVWCEKATTVDGKHYYHPVVKPKYSFGAMSEEMADPNNYEMISSGNQFVAYRDEPMIQAMAEMSGREIKLINVPKDVYQVLEKNLFNLMDSIFGNIREVFGAIDKIAEITKTDPEEQKQGICMDVLMKMDTLYSCVSEDMTVEDGNEHEYVTEDDYDPDCLCDECFDDEDDYEDEYDDEYDEDEDED